MSYKCNRCIIFRGEPRGPCEISLKTLEHDRKMAKIRIRYRFSDVLCINAYPQRSSITHFVIPAPYTSTCDKIQISKITFIFLIFVRPFRAIRGSTPFGGFHTTLQRVRLANRGRLPLKTPGPVPFGACICSNIETIFTWAWALFSDVEFRTSLGTSFLFDIGWIMNGIPSNLYYKYIVNDFYDWFNRFAFGRDKSLIGAIFSNTPR